MELFGYVPTWPQNGQVIVRGSGRDGKYIYSPMQSMSLPQWLQRTPESDENDGTCVSRHSSNSDGPVILNLAGNLYALGLERRDKMGVGHGMAKDHRNRAQSWVT
jgi:hypothetical protein